MKILFLIIGLSIPFLSTSQQSKRILSCSFKTGITTVKSGILERSFVWVMLGSSIKYYGFQKIKAIETKQAATKLFEDNLIISCEKLAKAPRLPYICIRDKKR